MARRGGRARDPGKSVRGMAQRAYRALLVAQRQLFGPDLANRHKALVETREHFRKT